MFKELSEISVKKRKISQNIQYQSQVEQVITIVLLLNFFQIICIHTWLDF